MSEPLFYALVGAAGTGKSYYIQQKIANDPFYCLRTSTTGIAAINIGGQTINHVLGFFDLPDLLLKLKYEKPLIMMTLSAIRARYRYLCIDEAFMQEADVLDIIYILVNEANQKPGRPLGILLSGDPGQLTPVVVDRKAHPVFTANCWNQFEIKYLNDVKRQSDREFINALLAIRRGEPEAAVDWIEENIGFHGRIEPDFPGPTIMTRNKSVDAYNIAALEKLPGNVMVYEPRRVGKQKPEWSSIPDQLILKPGCRVMLLANDLGQDYANGDLATVEACFPSNVVLTLDRSGAEINLQYLHRDNEVITGKLGPTGELLYKNLGHVEYLPLRLAYACTVHKVQGLSLSNVQVYTGEQFLGKLSGGLYTALSRCRTPGGLRIVGNRESFTRAAFVYPSYQQVISGRKIIN